METTPNNNIKIVRLQSGEDIVADMIEDEENDVVLLGNPMHMIFKRIPTGQTVMMMMPWLPVEIIKDNAATIYTSDILTIIDPKDELIRYYGKAVTETQMRMEQSTSLTDDDEYDEEDDDEYDDDEASLEEILEAMKEKKDYNIH